MDEKAGLGEAEMLEVLKGIACWIFAVGVFIGFYALIGLGAYTAFHKLRTSNKVDFPACEHTEKCPP